jgi:hypothetical protein
LNFYFLLGLVGAVFIFWVVAVLSFTRLSRKNPYRPATAEVQPALRLAEKWLSDSQSRIERLVEEAEQPLSAAQNELLELRLEAGRLPQGVKNLQGVRDLFDTSFQPMAQDKDLAAWIGLYLEPGDLRAGEGKVQFVKTPLGEMPILKVGRSGASLGETEMKEALGSLSRALDQTQATGGFLFLPESAHYMACLQNKEWMEGLKAHRLMATDLKGLTALLVSLRLAKDSEKVVKTFTKGVESTKALAGQTDLMSAELSKLTAHTLKAKTLLEGALPTSFSKTEE